MQNYIISRYILIIIYVYFNPVVKPNYFILEFLKFSLLSKLDILPEYSIIFEKGLCLFSFFLFFQRPNLSSD